MSADNERDACGASGRPLPRPSDVEARRARPGEASARPANAEAEAQRWVQGLARRIWARGLAAPAVFFFESLRPMNFVASQMLHVLAPVASLFLDARRLEEVALALEDRATLDRLVAEIEHLQSTEDRHPSSAR